MIRRIHTRRFVYVLTGEYLVAYAHIQDTIIRTIST